MTSHHSTTPQGDSQFAQRHPGRYLSAYAIVGAIAVVVFITLFLFIGHAVPMRDALTRGDAAVNAWMESHNTEPGETIFKIVSWIGAPVLVATVVITVAVFTRRRDWFHALAVVFVTGGGLVLTEVLKLTFHRARPLTASEFMTHPTYSFPSGHAMNSMIAYGFLAVLLLDRARDRTRRIAIVLSALLLTGAIGFSRVYLGVHFVTDVVGGWLAGAAWLLIGIGGYRFAARHYNRNVSAG